MGHTPRKRFGQNFLVDEPVVNRIVSAIHPAPSDQLVEIGPGQGALTGGLLESGCQLDVIELDRNLVPGLLAAFCKYPGFKLHNADALGFDFANLAERSGLPLRIVGNLPYNISTPLIFKLLEHCADIKDMHFMLQLEVVQRLAAEPGSKHWGRLGIMNQYFCRVEQLFEVPPEAFRPQPKVQSAVVRLTPWQQQNQPHPACDPATLRRVTQSAFAQRRKTLRNNLKGIIDESGLETLGIDPGARAEALDLGQFIAVANTLDE